MNDDIVTKLKLIAFKDNSLAIAEIYYDDKTYNYIAFNPLQLIKYMDGDSVTVNSMPLVIGNVDDFVVIPSDSVFTMCNPDRFHTEYYATSLIKIERDKFNSYIKQIRKTNGINFNFEFQLECDVDEKILDISKKYDILEELNKNKMRVIH